MRYRKKPVVIETFRMGIGPRPDWFQDEITAGNITTELADGETDDGNPWNHKKTYCMIKTLEGVMRGNYGDYIIRGVKGEIYPCKPDVFEATYESVERGITMSKTPRTDAETRLRSGQEVVLVGFARQLETELVEARGKIERLKHIKRCLREEFLLNTQNYPKEYHALFQRKFEAALSAAERMGK